MKDAADLIIKNTGRGHDWYGACEKCGKRCDLHYKQWRKSLGGHLIEGFGHIECLKTGAYANAVIDRTI